MAYNKTMNNSEQTAAIAQKLNEAINKELAKTIKTKTVDRKAFRDLFVSHDWHYPPAAINDDIISDQEFLAALQSVHEDVSVWAMPQFTKSLAAMANGNLVPLNLDDLDEDD